MVGKACRFQDHDAAELMFSPDSRKHKRIGRGVRNFDCTIRERVREIVVFPGTFVTEPGHESAPIELWHQALGSSHRLWPRVGYRSSGGRVGG